MDAPKFKLFDKVTVCGTHTGVGDVDGTIWSDDNNNVVTNGSTYYYVVKIKHTGERMFVAERHITLRETL